jgi:ceramide glucosyltransferase
MPPLTARFVLEVVAVIGTAGSLFFYGLSAASVVSFLNFRREKLRQAAPPDSELPPVSILKPLKGVDPEIWESFCSHCEQDYPQFQIIFGVSEGNDPAVEFVHKLQLKYPQLPIELIVCERILGTNVKVSNLVQMTATFVFPQITCGRWSHRWPIRRWAWLLACIAVSQRQLLDRGSNRWASAPTSFPEF